MNKLKGPGMVGSGNMHGTEVTSNKKTRSYKLGTMCHRFCLRCEGET